MLKWWFAGLMIMSMGKVSFSHEKTGIRESSIVGKFPNLCQMEDYYSCPPENSYCTVNMKLIPRDGKSDIWKELESWSALNFHYNRTIVYRTLCIPPCFRSGSQLKHFAESKANKELEAYNLTTQMLGYDCLKLEELSTDFISNLVMLGLHLGLVVVATLYDLLGGSGDKPNIVQKVVLCFSVMNYIKLYSKHSESVGHLKKIKAMDGVRLIITLIVISAHAFLGTCTKHLKNPEVFEQIFESALFQEIIKFSMVAVQIYFMMSSWLLTRQILNLHFLEGEFSIRHCILTFVHRIAKIWPLLFYVTLGPGLLFFYVANGPGGFELVNIIKTPCYSSKKYWTFLHVTNLFSNFDICHAGFWSLSLDVQYYLLNIIFMYVILKYKIDIKKSLAVLFATTYFIQAFQIYSNDVNLSLWLNIKLYGTLGSFNRPEFSYIYYGFFANYVSSLVGILFGYIDFQTRHMKRPVAYEKIYILTAVSLFFSFLLFSQDHSVLVISVSSTIIKASFSVGFCMLLYGTSRNIIRGPIKLMLEHRYVQVLASHSFAVYMLHFIWVWSRGSRNSALVEFAVPGMLWIYLQDFIISFALGVFGTATISIPALLLEQMIFPPVRRKVHGNESEIESKKM